MSVKLRYKSNARRLPPDVLNATILQWVDFRTTHSADLLTCQYWGLAGHLAKRYARLLRMDNEDVFSFALLGIVLGLRSYKRSHYEAGKKLINFVGNAIRWEILSHAPRLRYRIKLPSDNFAGKLAKAIDELRLDHPLSFDQMLKLAQHMQEPVKKVEMVYMAMKARDISQGTPVKATSLGLDATVEDKLESEWPSAEDFANKAILKLRINQLLLDLKPREERVIRLRFGMNCREHTLKEIGHLLGVEIERIRQIESKAFRKLRHPVYKILNRENVLYWKDGTDEPLKYSDAFGVWFGHVPYQ